MAEDDAVRIGSNLERMAKLGRLVASSAEPLARRLTDSARIPAAVATSDVLGLARLLSEYGTLLSRLAAGTIDHPLWAGRTFDPAARAPRGAVAATLPEDGAATAFGLLFAPTFLCGADLAVHPAPRTRSLFQTLEALAAEEGLGSLLKRRDGASLFSRAERPAFLAEHLDPTCRTAVLALHVGSGRVEEATRQSVLRKKEEFRLLVEGPAMDRFVVAAPLADPAPAARALVDAALAGGGRARGRAEVVDVHESVLPQLLPLVVELAATAVVGDPYEAPTRVGPFPLERARAVAARVDDALARGATLAYATERAGKLPLLGGGGDRPSFLLPPYRGSEPFAFLPFVVLAGLDDGALLASEPAGGPVLAIRAFREDRELVPRILGSPCGHGATLFGDDAATRHADLLQVLTEGHGTVRVNAPPFVGAEGPDPLLLPTGGFRETSYALLPGTVEGVPALTELQTGPSFTFLSLTKAAGGAR